MDWCQLFCFNRKNTRSRLYDAADDGIVSALILQRSAQTTNKDARAPVSPAYVPAGHAAQTVAVVLSGVGDTHKQVRTVRHRHGQSTYMPMPRARVCACGRAFVYAIRCMHSTEQPLGSSPSSPWRANQARSTCQSAR